MSEFVLEPGAIIAGKIRIERVLGRGGMGVVASGYHLQLEKLIAVKLMLPHAAQDPEAVSRFLREARAAARITSEHVARVFDVGSLPTGEPYIAMEYLEGSDIAELLARNGRFEPGEAVAYLLQACEALEEAHAAGVVHRDLKPGNLFLTRRSGGSALIKVLDFGISKMTHSSPTASAQLTRTSAMMGSPLYMSPEQMTSPKEVDARSDIWSLGVVLYEMLSGAAPFNGETLPQVCLRIVSEAPPPLSGLSPELVGVVERCLQKSPNARYQNIAELAQALRTTAPAREASQPRFSSPHTPPPPGPPIATSPSVPPAGPAGRPEWQARITHATWSETRKPPARLRWRLSLVFAVCALAALGVGIVHWRQPSPTQPAASSSSSALGASSDVPVARPAAVVNAPTVAPALSASSVEPTPTHPAPAAPRAPLVPAPKPALHAVVSTAASPPTALALAAKSSPPLASVAPVSASSKPAAPALRSRL